MGTKPQQSKPAMPKKNRARIKKKEEETDYIDGGKKLLLILILNCSQDLLFFSSSYKVMQLHVQVCMCVFFLCAGMRTPGLPQYSPCALWARGAWLSSYHTVAHGTCPVIRTDLLDLSADSQTSL